MESSPVVPRAQRQDWRAFLGLSAPIVGVREWEMWALFTLYC